MVHQKNVLPILIGGFILLGVGVVVFFLIKKKDGTNLWGEKANVVTADGNDPHPTEANTSDSTDSTSATNTPPAPSPTAAVGSDVSPSTQLPPAPTTGLSILSALNAPHPVDKIQKTTVDSMGSLEPQVLMNPSEAPIRQVATGLTKPSVFNPLVQQSLPGIYQAGGFSGSAYYLQDSPAQLNSLMQVVFNPGKADTPLHAMYTKKSQEIAARNRVLNDDNKYLNLVGEDREFNGTYFMTNQEKAAMRPYDYNHSSQDKGIEEEIDREYEIQKAKYANLSTTPVFS